MVGARSDEQALFDELSCYTLSHGDPRFLHQHAVDAYTAQTASETTKTIAIVFALLGLSLFLEQGFTGRQVQRVHMEIAKRRVPLPRPPLPVGRGAMRVQEVLGEHAGRARDEAIARWCASVWAAYSAEGQQMVRDFVAAQKV